MSERTSGNRKKLLVQIGVAAVLLIILFFAIRSATHSDVPVRATSVTYGDLLSSIATNGKVEPMQNFSAHAADPGSVQAVYVRSGQRVAAGTLLLKMDASTADARVETARSAIAQAQAAQFDVKNGGTADERIGITGDLQRAQLQVTQARNDLTALQNLQAKGAASANEVAGAQQRLASAQSSLDSLQQRSTARYAPTDRERVGAQLADSRANLAAAQHTLANEVVRAPFAGTVYSLPVRPFDFVPSGDELVSLADLTHMQVRAYFDEPDIGKLHNDDAVVITWDAKPNLVWHGHIVRTPTTVMSYGSRNVGECLVAVDDATGDLLPNTNVTVKVTTQQIYHVLSVPREALHTENSENFVFLVQNGKLVKRPIQVGAINLMTVQVLSGLSNGDTVALATTRSDTDLADGLRVSVVQQ